MTRILIYYVGTYNFGIRGYVPNICCNFIAPTIYEMYVFGFINNYLLSNSYAVMEHGPRCNMYLLMYIYIYYLKTKRYCEIVNWQILS